MVFDDMKKCKALDRVLVMQQMRDKGIMERLEGPIAVKVVFYMGGAATRTTAKYDGLPKPKKPDIDNMAKYYLDVMNDLVYVDDRMITELWCEKLYSVKPKVEIIISKIEQDRKKPGPIKCQP